MSNERDVHPLQRHQIEQSERKQAAVLRSVADFQERGESITVSAIGRAAGVSRDFIYGHSHLTRIIRDAASLLRSKQEALPNQVNPHIASELRADRKNLAGQVAKQRSRITELEGKVTELERLRMRWLGAQLPGVGHIDPEVHSELRIASERITAENVQLNRQIGDLRKQVAQLTGELAASRQAHSEDASEWAAIGGQVTPIVKPHREL